MRPTWADIDLDAIGHNIQQIDRLVGEATVCAVVKADGYGHGALATARAAIDAGATWVAVATVEEGKALRTSGLTVPILLLSEPAPNEMIEVVAADLTPSVYSGEGLAAAEAAASHRGVILNVHVKINTGMNRVGADPSDTVLLVQAIVDKPSLHLQGLWTHCAVADEIDDPFTNVQLDVFDDTVAAVRAAGHEVPMVHAANSAAALAFPRSRYDMVRVGIATYGVPPSEDLAGVVSLQPAMTIRSAVSMVKKIEAGARVSYGLRWEASETTTIATVPIGYADGIRRRTSAAGGVVLVGGRRCPMVGTVTMDQLMVDCGPDATVKAGDEVILVGVQGDDAITANEIAGWLDTIGYEVVCDVESRVPRRYR